MSDVEIVIPEPFQVLFEENKYRFKVFYGGRGSAKSHSFARAALIRAAQKKIRVLCAREIQVSIKDSVHKLLGDLINNYNLNFYTVKNDSIINTNTGSEFIFRGIKHNVQEIKSMEAIDIAWCEEAQSISHDSLNVLIPTIRKENSEIWFSFNRFLEHDPVYDRFCRIPEEKTFVKKVSFRDNPFFNETMREEMKRDRARSLDEYLWIWEGEPLYQSEDSILDRAEIDAAMKRIISDTGQVEIGVDVARFGSDRTVMFKRKGLKIVDYKIYTKLSIDETVDKIKMFCTKEDLIKVDSTGMGGGVSDFLRRDGYKAIDINFGQKPKNPDKYDMAISEMWFEFKSLINEISIPVNSELFDELVNRKWRIDKKGRRCVESKDDYKKRGNRSPDMADALLLSYYNYVKYGLFNNQPDKKKTLPEKKFENKINRLEKKFHV